MALRSFPDPVIWIPTIRNLPHNKAPPVGYTLGFEPGSALWQGGPYHKTTKCTTPHPDLLPRDIARVPRNGSWVAPENHLEGRVQQRNISMCCKAQNICGATAPVPFCRKFVFTKSNLA
jgi:hypothetical protein